MSLLKNNKKLILGFIIGIILTSGVVYAAISASDVTYCKDGTNTISVSDALNELYDLSQLHVVKIGDYSSTGHANVDIKNKVSDYTKLTKDNFWLRNVRCSYTSAAWGDYNLGGVTETISYNASTGVVSVLATYGAWNSSKHAFYLNYSLYCIY